jgi:hypothetical protein
MRPHGCAARGRSVQPCVCLPVSMRPYGRPRSLDGCILPPACLHPWGRMAVRVVRRDTPFRCMRATIVPYGYADHAVWVHASDRRGHRRTRMGASLPSTRVPVRPMRSWKQGKGSVPPRDGHTDRQGRISPYRGIGTPKPTTRAPMRGDGSMDAGPWMHPCRRRARSSSAKVGRVRLFGARIRGIGDGQAGQGALRGEGMPRGARPIARARSSDAPYHWRR